MEGCWRWQGSLGPWDAPWRPWWRCRKSEEVGRIPAFVGTRQPHGPLEVLWLVKLDVDAESLRQSPSKELGLL